MEKDSEFEVRVEHSVSVSIYATRDAEQIGERYIPYLYISICICHHFYICMYI